MTVGKDSQLDKSFAPAPPGFGTPGTLADGCVGPIDLGLKSPSARVTLLALHQSQIEHFSPHPMQSCALPGNVAEKRRNEFLLGRAAARLALIGAGWPNPSPLMRQSGGDPDWPAGIVGSITHSSAWAVAAVASSCYVKALGIDLEHVPSVPEMEIAELVCRAPEFRWVFAGRESQLRTAMLFSAKESVYKALYPRCRRFFAFQDVELTWVQHGSKFRCVLLTELGSHFSAGFRFEVHCQQKGPFVFTYVVINAAGFEKSRPHDCESAEAAI